MTGPATWVRVQGLKQRRIHLYFYLLLFLLLLSTSVVVIFGGYMNSLPQDFLMRAHEKSQSIEE